MVLALEMADECGDGYYSYIIIDKKTMAAPPTDPSTDTLSSS